MKSAYPFSKQIARAKDIKRRPAPQQVQQAGAAASPQQGDAVFWAWAAPNHSPERSESTEAPQ
jgi:hypothetical protein